MSFETFEPEIPEYNECFNAHLINLMDEIRGKADIWEGVPLITDDNFIEPLDDWQTISFDTL